MKYFWCIYLLLLSVLHLNGQASFVSNTSSGTWNSSGSWTLISGADSDGIPDGDDNVILNSGHTIRLTSTESCAGLDFSGGTLAFQSNGALDVTGNVTTTASSSITGWASSQVLNISGNLSVSSGFTLTIGAITPTVSGTTTVNGVLTFSGHGRTNTFGNTIVNSGGTITFSSGGDIVFSGNLTNNGTFTASAYGQTFTFESSSGVISGTGQMSFFNAVFNSPAAYTNNGSLQIRNSLTGTGSFTNGASGNLELQNGGTFSVTTFDASAAGNTITYTGHSNPTSFSGDYYNLVLNKSSGSLSFGSSLSVLNDLKIMNGILAVGAVTLSIGNDLSVEGGEFSPNNSSAEVNVAGDLTMSNGEYDHNNGDVNVTGDLNFTGGAFNLDGASSTVDAANATFTNLNVTLNNGALATTGDMTVGTGTTFKNPGASTTVGGTFRLNDGAAEFTSGTFSPKDINVAANKALSITNAVLNSSGTSTINGTISFTGSSGTKMIGSIQVNSGGTWNVTQAINFTVSGNITNNGTFNGSPDYGSGTYSLTSGSGTIGGTGNIVLRNVLIDNPASYTNTGNLTITTSLTGSGTLINGTNGSFTYSGNNSTGSNFNITSFKASATGNTVTFNGATDQQLRTTTDTDNNYHNLVINTTAAGNDVTLAGNITIDNQLTLTMGDIFLSSNRLTIASGAAISGGGTDSYIGINGTGVLRKGFTAAGSTLSFPMGDANDYSPITAFTINSGTFSAGAYVEFDVTDANHPNRNTNNTASGGDDDGTTAVDFISCYWTLTGNNISDVDFDVTGQYVDADVTGTEANMVGAVYRMPPGETFLDWHVAGTVNATNNTVSISNVDAFGDLYAMDNTLGRLPIVLISFETRVLENAVELEWVTASEENNEFFTIERSADGQDFFPVRFIPGAGNSSELITYTARDDSPLRGRSFYRLKQTDFTGEFAYSEIRSALYEGKSEALKFSVYPNPASTSDEVRLILPAKLSHTNLSLRLTDASGKVISSSYNIGSNETRLKVAALKRGIYIIQITDGIQLTTEKLIVR